MSTLARPADRLAMSAPVLGLSIDEFLARHSGTPGAELLQDCLGILPGQTREIPDTHAHVNMWAWYKKRWFQVTRSDTQGGSAPDSWMRCRGVTRGGFNANAFPGPAANGDSARVTLI
jgi:hypothetical protein